MSEDDRQPSELSNYIHLFLSGSDRKSVSGTVTAEHVIWLIFPEGSPLRALFASGASSFIAARGSPVTLIEVGRGLPNSGYYFALDPDRYLIPWLDGGICINETISPLLRFACATEVSLLEPFKDSFGLSSSTHFIINAFSYGSESETPSPESVAKRNRIYSIRDSVSRMEPDALIVINWRPEEDTGQLLARVRELAPDASIFMAGDPAPGDEMVAGVERVPLPGMNELKPEIRKPPAGGSFISFMNAMSQRISAGLRLRGKKTVG